MRDIGIGVGLTVVVAVAGIVTSQPACGSAPEPTSAERGASDHPADRLRAEIREREISPDTAAERLDELRVEIGADEPAKFHLAAARLNAYQGDPESALDALEAALEADEKSVDDELRVELAEYAWRSAGLKGVEDDASRRAIGHLVETDLEGSRLDTRRVERYRFYEITRALEGHVPDDRAVERAYRHCERVLEDPHDPASFVVPCARAAHLRGDPEGAGQLVLDWVDDQPGLLEQLDGVLQRLDEIRLSPVVARVLADNVRDSVQWRIDLGRALTERGARLLRRLDELPAVTVTPEDRLAILRLGAEFAYLDGDVAGARRFGGHDESTGYQHWVEQTEVRRRDRGPGMYFPRTFVELALLFGDERLGERFLDAEQPLASSDIRPDQRRHSETPSDTLEIAEADVGAESVRAWLFLCLGYSEANRGELRALTGRFASVQTEEFDELYSEHCPVDERRVDRGLVDAEREVIEAMVAAQRRGEREITGAFAQWLVEHHRDRDALVESCQTPHRDCPPALIEGLAADETADGAERPGEVTDPQAPVVPAAWRSEGPLPKVHGAAASPDGQRLATLHVGEYEGTGLFGRPVPDEDRPAFRRTAAPSLVVWDEQTGTIEDRHQLSLERDRFIGDSIEGSTRRLEWVGDRIVVVTTDEVFSVDTADGEFVSRQVADGELGPGVDPRRETVATARRSYRHGPIELRWLDVTDLEVVDERMIWSGRALADWDRLAGVGTLVRNTEEGVEIERLGESIYELDLGSAPVAMVRLGPAGRFLYLVSDNVYVVDLEERDARVAFGRCPTGIEGLDPTLDDSVNLPGIECGEPMTRPIRARVFIRPETAVTFRRHEDGELPWIPEYHHGESIAYDIIDLATGDEMATECRDIEPDSRSWKWSVGTQRFWTDSVAQFGEDSHRCGTDHICNPVFTEEMQGATTNSPMILGYIRDHDHGYRDEAMLVWADDQTRQWDEIHFGRRGEVTNLRFSPAGDRLVTSAQTPLHSVTMRGVETGEFEWTLPTHFGVDAALDTEETRIVAAGLQAGAFGGSSEFYPGIWSLETALVEGCAPGPALAEGTVEGTDQIGVPPVSMLEYDADEYDWEVPTADDFADEIRREVYREDHNLQVDDDQTIAEAVAEAYEIELEEGQSAGDHEDVRELLELFDDRSGRTVERRADRRAAAAPRPTTSWIVIEPGDQSLLVPEADVGIDLYEKLDRTDICPDRDVAAIADIEEELHLRDLREGGRLVEHVRTDEARVVASVDFADDCRLVVALRARDEEQSHQIAIFEPEADGWAEARRVDIDVGATPTAVAWKGTDGVVVGTVGGPLKVFSVVDGRTTAVLEGLTAPASTVAAGPDERFVAAGAVDGQTAAWRLDAEGGESIAEDFEEADDDD